MSDEKKPETKAPDELELKIDKLTLTKTGYERNRNLTGCVVVLFGYYIYTGIRDGDGTWWFYLLMGVMFLVSGLILWHSWKATKEMQTQIDELIAEKKARDEAAAEEAAAASAEEPAAIEAGAADEDAPADKAGAAPAAEAAASADESAPADEAASDNQASDADKA